MLYLILPLLAIGAKAQTDAACETVAGTVNCGDDLVKAAYTTLYGADVELSCYDLTLAQSNIASGVYGCYPPYCGTDASACATGESCIATYCGTPDIDTGGVTECSSTEECATGEACITGTIGGVTGSVCVEGACNDENDCSDPLPACITNDILGYGVCSVAVDSTTIDSCTSTSECDAGSACVTTTLTGADTKICVIGACNDAGDCSSPTPDCVTGLLGYNVCSIADTSDTDCDCNDDGCSCDTGEVCITLEGEGVCATGDITVCTSSSQCSGDVDTCATDLGFCYKGCSSNSNCATGQTCQTNPLYGLKYCDVPDCTATTECGTSLVCTYEDGAGDGTCVECNDAGDCESGESCVDNVCLADSCADDSSACGNYVCADDGTCVICELDGTTCPTGTTCQAVDGVNNCYAYDTTAVNNNEDGINQITTYIAMVIMAMVAVNM